MQNVDPFDKPWLKLAARTPAKPTGSKGKVTSARVRGLFIKFKFINCGQNLCII